MVKEVICTLCGKPAVCPDAAVPLCEEHIAKIERQLREGKFLG